MQSQEQTLILSQSFEPIKIVSWQRAITLLFLGKAEVIEEYDRNVKTTSIVFKVPAVVRLLNAFRRHKKPVKFSRINIYGRDKYTCFGAGTRILMADGRQKPIDEVRPGECVLDAFGKPTEVIAIGNRVVDDAVYVKHRGSGERTLTTSEHPFLTPSGEFVPISRRPEYLTFPRTVQYVVPSASDVEVAALLPQEDWFRLRGGRIYWSRRSTEAGLPVRLPATAELAYVLGLFVADGSTTINNGAGGSRAVWSFNVDQKATLAAAVQRWADGLGLHAGIATLSHSDGLKVIVSNKMLAIILRTLCGDHVTTKRVPWGCIGQYRVEFLRGLFLGDGHIDRKNKKVVLLMAAYDAIFGAQALLWGLGIYPTVHMGERPERLPTWSLVLQGENYSRFLEQVLGEKSETGERIYGNERFIFRKLQSVESVEDEVIVYNMETASHSYIANGLAVHNCQYCGTKKPIGELTYDHVVPRSRGGKTTWTNIATCCTDCNGEKANRTPEQAGMKLLKTPVQPSATPVLVLAVSRESVPDAWRDYLYWTSELDED